MKRKNLNSVLLLFIVTAISYAQNGDETITTSGERAGEKGKQSSYYGFRAGQKSEGENNSFYGANAGRDNSTGIRNTFLGYNSGKGNKEGSRNVFVGVGSGKDNLGSRNVFIGNQAGAKELGSQKLYIANSNTATPLISNGLRNYSFGKDNLSISNGSFSLFSFGFNSATDFTIRSPKGFESFIFKSEEAGSTKENIEKASLILPSINSRISIGTAADDPDYKLTVKGKIHVQEVKVDLEGAIMPDYVFEKEYELNTLEEVQEYINKEGHLPNIPSAAEVEESGINLKEMNLKLLEKIEELTLYTIEQQEEIKKQQQFNQDLLERLAKLEVLIKK